MGILVFACAFLTGAVGAITFRAVGHGGHVEIAPAAIAHARAAHRVTKREARPTPPPPAPLASAPAAFLSGVHEPKALLARARELQSLGLDVSVVDVQMGKPFTEWPDRMIDFWPTASVPLYGRDHRLDGLEIHGIPRHSALRVAGLVDGDQLLGIDGSTLAEDKMEIDPNVIRHRGWMVVEIARGDHHVVLSIHWPVGSTKTSSGT